jgi:uncharacterized membrane protein
MNREFRTQDADRPALLGDRRHTHRMARRAAIAVFMTILLILAPLTYGLMRAGLGPVDQFGMADAVLVGFIVFVAAAAIAFAVMIVIHLLGREARRRR